MILYADYINIITNNQTSYYVFINLKDFTPLKYTAVDRLFRWISKKIGFKITTHMLRHTHATELIKTGIDASLVQKRLGHSSI